MSTRCQTFITCKGEPVATIYRHCDGYPSGMGKDLAEMCGRKLSAQALVVKILTAWNFNAELEEVSAKHGDTEYEYYVDFPCNSFESAVPMITVKNLRSGKELSGSGWGFMANIEKVDD